MRKPDYAVLIEPLSEEDGGGFLATVPDLPALCNGKFGLYTLFVVLRIYRVHDIMYSFAKNSITRTGS